jgi:hypothetical protein
MGCLSILAPVPTSGVFRSLCPTLNFVFFIEVLGLVTVYYLYFYTLNVYKSINFKNMRENKRTSHALMYNFPGENTQFSSHALLNITTNWEGS